MRIALLTGGKDKPYNLGLLSALVDQDIEVDFIANDEMYESDIARNRLVNYYNLRGDQSIEASMGSKVFRVLKYYMRLIHYATCSKPKIFHIQWVNKFIYFDRTVLNLYYKMLGKKLVYTAHNIDERERDGNQSWFNELTLRMMYSLMDHVFVHTEKMKQDLIKSFSIRENKISVIPFGINDTVPNTHIGKEDARKKLTLGTNDRVMLFFGNIAPYKGLDILVRATSIVAEKVPDIKLVIAGRIKDAKTHWEQIEHLIQTNGIDQNILRRIEYIPDEEVECYYKAADVLILPYRFIYQSGVLFLSYNFGLPVIATDVGSLKENISEGKTGYICEPDNPDDLAGKIMTFFNSDLYGEQDSSREYIIDYAKKRYSWNAIGKTTRDLYVKMLSDSTSSS